MRRNTKKKLLYAPTLISVFKNKSFHRGGWGGGGFGTNDFFRGVYRYFLKQLTCVLRLPEAGCSFSLTPYPFPLPPSPLLHTTRMYEVIPHVLFLILKRNILFFQWHLNVGGHQLPLKHILPSTVARLTEESFDGITKVPVCSVLIRLLPHSEVCYVHIYKHVYHVVNIFSVEKF